MFDVKPTRDKYTEQSILLFLNPRHNVVIEFLGFIYVFFIRYHFKFALEFVSFDSDIPICYDQH